MIPDEEKPRAIIIIGKSGQEPSIENELKAHGMTVQWARSIKAASGLLESAPSGTLVITEVAVSDGDWRDLVARLRSIGKRIPVVLLSPTRTAKLWWDALECGVEEILQAPLSSSQLRKYLAKRFKAER